MAVLITPHEKPMTLRMNSFSLVDASPLCLTCREIFSGHLMAFPPKSGMHSAGRDNSATPARPGTTAPFEAVPVLVRSAGNTARGREARGLPPVSLSPNS